MDNFKEINLAEIFSALLRKLWLILLAAVIAGAAVYVYTDTVVTPMYKSRITLYVCNSTSNIGNLIANPNGEESYFNITAADLATSQRLVATYIEMLESNRVMKKVAANMNEKYKTPDKYSAASIKSMVTAAPLNETEIFEVVVASSNKELARDVANEIAKVAPAEIEEIVVGSKASVIDEAELATSPYAPNVRTSTVIGMIVGAVIAICAVVLQTLLDVRIKGEEDLVNISNAPVLGLIPDLAMDSKDHYGYASGYKYKAYKAYKAYGAYTADPPASAEKEQGGAAK